MTSVVSQKLEKFSLLNSYFEEDKIYSYHDINVGLAINIEKGLKVVAVKKTNRLSVEEVCSKSNMLFMDYMRDDFSDPTVLTSSTFTITDLSLAGVYDFTPIVNIKQSAILGICAPDFTKTFFNLVLSFDHRVCDGMYAAQFFKSILKGLEDLVREI